MIKGYEKKKLEFKKMPHDLTDHDYALPILINPNRREDSYRFEIFSQDFYLNELDLNDFYTPDDWLDIEELHKTSTTWQTVCEDTSPLIRSSNNYWLTSLGYAELENWKTEQQQRSKSIREERLWRTIPIIISIVFLIVSFYTLNKQP